MELLVLLYFQWFTYWWLDLSLVIDPLTSLTVPTGAICRVLRGEILLMVQKSQTTTWDV